MEPDVVFLMESELWPELLEQARKRGAPVFLINARLSDRSFARYEKIKGLAHSLAFDRVRLILTSSARDTERWKVLSPSAQVEETGNLKLHRKAIDESTRLEKREQLLPEFGIEVSADDPQPPFILFGNSTWPGEEEMLLDAQARIRANGNHCILVLVPRHAERRDELRTLLQSRGTTFHFRSENKQAPLGTLVYVGDTTGELYGLLHAADLAFIGKSLPPNTGGQNPIEAVSLGLPIVFGADMTNFHDISRSLIEAGAAKEAADASQCIATILELVDDREARKACARASREWIRKQQGALDHTADVLRNELKKISR
jgi:3-deoxy-D-manno-octulosonic-acid transferase